MEKERKSICVPLIDAVLPRLAHQNVRHDDDYKLNAVLRDGILIDLIESFHLPADFSCPLHILPYFKLPIDSCVWRSVYGNVMGKNIFLHLFFKKITISSLWWIYLCLNTKTKPKQIQILSLCDFIKNFFVPNLSITQ